MKTIFLKTGAALLLSVASIGNVHAQGDSLGLPGDNFDLYGALDLYKQSSNTEAFEKAINNSDNHINNLDLNNDGEVDYIKVVDRSAGDAKVLIMQDVISENESQDVAVIEMEKQGNENVHLQIVGDEAMYGKNYIIEPKDEQAKSAVPARTSGPAPVRTHVFVNVWAWPGVYWMYGPSYVVYTSPYRWHAYPVWWRPWRPVAWRVYYPRVRHFHYPYYHRVYVYNVPRAHQVYYGHRTTSTIVVNRNKTTLVHRGAPSNRVDRKVQPNHVKQQKTIKQKQLVAPRKKNNERRAN